ncbi:peroxisomal carnitine o-octanoyltransferase-like [Plakobranchus ocellatus]|uniref:Peroxisomal carnitine o-octanoyltransferase-like n=1 Tax=Plakobranchus ocellatus TaxID=259542 RepID=A0AAV4AMZ5_9GAST|nr:peroxisomal carnitine o-octanoyltransferase-like [Plakobranchus ocellatus]
MSNIDSFPLKNAASKSTTRLTSSLIFEYPFDASRCTSRRRSLSQRTLLPRLSVGPSAHIIKFAVENDDFSRKTPKQTLSTLTDDYKLSMRHQELLEGDLKSFESMQMQGAFPSPRARFTGEMWLQNASEIADIEVAKTLELDTNVETSTPIFSHVVTLGDVTPCSYNEMWPWPWLPPTLTSSEYISNSKLPVTFSHQNNLPVVPILPLNDALQTYLGSVRLFLKPDKLAQVERLLESFKESSGKNLQENIITASSSISISNNISCTYWSPNVVACLSRLEAPLANSGILAPYMWDLWPERSNSQIDRAVILIQLVSEFARLLYSERLNVFYDELGHPLCNHQFRKLFSSAKIPGIPSDGTHCFFKSVFEPSHQESPKHIIVICRGQMFSLDIILEEFTTLPAKELNMNLQQILSIAEENTLNRQREEYHSIGILSALDRDLWSETRLHLMELSDNNRSCLQKLEEAMFVLSLDHMKVRGPDRLINEALFADGFNRWYDKGLSFYIYQNGLLTINVCSSIVDASIANDLLRFMHLRILEDAEKWDDEALKSSGVMSRCVSNEITTCLSSISNLVDQPDDNVDLTFPSVPSITDHLCILAFDLDDTLKNIINDGMISFTQLSENVSSAMCDFEMFNMSLLIDREIDPDAFAHLAMQLTFYKMYFRPAAVGSKVGIRRFYHSHYDTMITTSEESIAWCRIMFDSSASLSERRKLFSAAVKKHVQTLEQVRSGKGCFSHMSALREAALNSCDPTAADILNDMSDKPGGSPESMEICCECLDPRGSLSVPVVVPQTISSYGVGYALANGKALFTVCSWKDNPGTCAELFARSLWRCLEELQNFLLDK